jgi:hypothetical protein
MIDSVLSAGEVIEHIANDVNVVLKRLK